MSEKDNANLLAILAACGKIRKFVEGLADSDTFYEEEKTFDAVTDELHQYWRIHHQAIG